MLFQRLYNWIKYKTLPSSFLFKNRLFIERDSKHKRIFSNFGLNFRSSKWSNYDTYNIKTSFRTAYIKFIMKTFIICVTALIVYFINKYYVNFFSFNNLSFIFWTGVDTIDYYISFMVWFIAIFSSFLTNLFYSYFFYNNFSWEKHIRNFFLRWSIDETALITQYEPKHTFVSKEDLNLILYSWLSNKNTTKNVIITKKLFNEAIPHTWWTTHFDTFNKLYKLTNLLSAVTTRFNKFIISKKLEMLDNKYFKNDREGLMKYFYNSDFFRKHNDVLLMYLISNTKNYFEESNLKSTSTRFLDKRYEWNLYNIEKEMSKSPSLVKTKYGQFFFDNFNYSNFSNFIFNFKELQGLTSFIKNQFNSAKWNRWLYKYSILHRKIVKNSHKLTTTKKLLTTGIYDSKIFNKNLWSSAQLSKYSSSEPLSSLFNMYRFNFSKSSNLKYLNTKIKTLGNDKQSNNLTLLNHHENSYFWFTKRFYFFNELTTNFITSSYKKNNFNTNKIFNNLNQKNNIFLNYSSILSYFLKLPFPDLNYIDKNNNFKSITDYSNKESTLFNNNYKDTYLLNNENEIFNQENLNILFWISNSLKKNNNFIFFNYLTNESLNYRLNQTKFFANLTNLHDLNLWIAYTTLNSNTICVEDLTYLTLFY